MATVNLVNDPESVVTGNDNIVIVKVIDTIRGGRSLDVTGYTPSVIPAGHVIIRETATDEYKPMPVISAAPNGVATVGSVTAGSGYTNGTYENVPLSGGTGSGMLATVVVSGAEVSTVTVTQAGSGYTVADVLSVPAAYAGGTGSGGSVPVATLSSVEAAYADLPASHTYAGILIASIPTDRPFAGIMIRGVVNPAASTLPLTSIQSAVSTALPHIIFQAD